MALVEKDEDLRSFDVPEVTRHPSGYTIYKIIMQVTPKEITENSYQVCSHILSIGRAHCLNYAIDRLLETVYRYSQTVRYTSAVSSSNLSSG